MVEGNTELVCRNHNQGHEIDSHGFRYNVVYYLSRKGFYRDIERSKRISEDLFGEVVLRHRAPNSPIADVAIEEPFSRLNFC